MSPELTQIAARIVKQASVAKPADFVLRVALREEKGLPRATAGQVSRAVFAYFRWRGWLNPNDPMERQLAQGLELAERFHISPQSFGDDELARAVPEWAGGAMEISPAWLRTLQTEPRLWLRAKQGQGEILAQKLGECWIPDAAAFADAVEYQGGEDLFRTPEFQAGEFEIQDISSQAVGLLCDPKPGETWWDACAGEGGKMLHLSDLMQNKGLIWASDRAARRLQLLKRRAGRAKCFNYRAALWDGGPGPPTKTRFGGVLVDAPCSGVGTWQRNPHARWTTTPEDVRELAEIQKQLLAHVAGSVKPDGKLIYAVCALTRAETVGVVDWFNREIQGFEPLPLPGIWRAEQSLLTSDTVTIWPQELGSNGMYVAGWKRRKC